MSTCVQLSQRLRSATHASHARAERVALMQQLMAGQLPLADYLGLLEQFRALYGALESALTELAARPQVARLCPPPLWRSAALAEDIRCLGLLGPPALPRPLVPATLAYVDRLQYLARHAPMSLLAHAYVRYLGDLYGGQMLARRLRQQHGLPEGQGTRFYAFGDAAQVQALIIAFRAALDDLPLAPSEADALVGEACDAFERHVQIFDQLMPASPAAQLV